MNRRHRSRPFALLSLAAAGALLAGSFSAAQAAAPEKKPPERAAAQKSVSKAATKSMMSAAAAAAPSSSEMADAVELSPGSVQSVTVNADSSATAVTSDALNGFPTAGPSYLYLSTGAAAPAGGSADDVFYSTNLPGAPGGADGNDLTQVTFDLKPPANASCIALDFSMLSEEYPDFVGSSYNDIFTAEINESIFQIDPNSQNQVISPNNFAYDEGGAPLSINTTPFSPSPDTVFNGVTPGLTASAPIELDLATQRMKLILSIQDLGDSIYDSAVFVDNVRWIYGAADCSGGVTALTDTDGDGLSDAWETEGIDYDKDGIPELDLPAMGADPQHKDIFLEIDYMKKAPTCFWFFCFGGKNFAPQAAAVQAMVTSFANAPLTNPDGVNGIRMHVDAGPGYVMSPASGATWGSRSKANALSHVASLGTVSGGAYDWSAFETIKQANFDFSRRDAFHYVVYADTYAGSGSSGISRGIPASDLLVTDGHPGWNKGAGFTLTQERGTLMHELGHNLSLYHGGGPTGTSNYSAGYKSIMNYAYQLTGLPPGAGLDYSRGAPYDDWANIRFDGGSVGDLGDSAPPVEETPDDSLTADEAKANNVFAAPGDGTVTFLGPTVVIADGGTAQLNFEVTNASDAAASYVLDVSVPGFGAVPSTPVDVPADGTVTVPVDIDTAGLTPGEFPLTATLTHSGAPVSTTDGTLTVPDFSDPATQAAAQDALDDLDQLPDGAGPNAEQLDALEEEAGGGGGGGGGGDTGPTIDGQAPSVSGTPVVDGELEADEGDWDQPIASYAYQWLRDGNPIGGANGELYSPRLADLGHLVSVRVTATSPEGLTGSATSAAEVIGRGEAPTADSPEITGPAVVGGTLSTSTVTWSRPGVSTTYQWLVDNSPIPGATGMTYTPTEADAGRSISVEAIGTLSGYQDGSAKSGSVRVSGGSAPAPTGLPMIEGTPRVGQPLTATEGTWDQEGLDFAFQWTRDGSPISGATSRSYGVVPADAGRLLGVVVTATADGQAPGQASAAAVRVARLASALTISPNQRLTKVRGVLSVPGLSAPGGSLVLRVNGQEKARRSVANTNAGRFRFRLPARPDKLRVVVIYLGSPAAGPARERFVIQR